MIGIRFYFGFASDPNKRIQKIKDYGFDAIITSPDKKYNKQNTSIKNQVKLAKENGLKLSSMHSTYKNELLPYFWQPGLKGWLIKRKLIKEARFAKKLGFACMVVHLDGKFSNLGKNRLLQVLAVAKKIDLPLAIENLTNEDLLIDVFKNIEHPYLKLCFDAGHNNCFTPNLDVLSMFGKHLVAVHLHDNLGKTDDHTLNLFGNIDWDAVAKKLANCPPVSLDYELAMYNDHDITEDECLEICIKQGKDLEFLIEKYRRENLSKVSISFK